jgi:hypothetical protein
MPISAELKATLAERFATLAGGEIPWPPPATLSKTLTSLIPPTGTRRNVTEQVAAHYCTAAVDMWLRGVHSFLASVSMTNGSPVWSSVSGYYASHYAIRGLAHLEGFFQLHYRRKVARLASVDGAFSCTFENKSANNGEHQVYWKLLKDRPDFRGDDMFTINKIDQAEDASDIRHRSYANYADHLAPYGDFSVLNQDEIKERIETISKISFDAAPIPRVSMYADIDYVQIVAYHRLVRFRSVVDDALGSSNAFWNGCRNPAFVHGLMDFQLVGSSLSS